MQKLEIPTMTVEECADVMSMSPKVLREAIDNGSFEFGRCFRSAKGSPIYKISRTAFFRWWNGDGIEDI